MKISFKGVVLFLVICLLGGVLQTASSEDVFYLASESIFKEYTSKENPYKKEEYVARKYKVLQSAYNLDAEFADRKGETEVMLIGVGRGYGALEMALKYPNLSITAVNKEKNLFNPALIRRYYDFMYGKTKVTQALKRITLKIADIEEEALGEGVKNSYDVIVFETNVLMYLMDKLMTVESLFNNNLKQEGALFFETDAVYGTEELYDGGERAASPDMIFSYVRDEIAKKGHYISDTRVAYYGEAHNLRLQKNNEENVMFPVEIHDDLTAYESIMVRHSKQLTVDASVAPFLSIYVYKNRKAFNALAESA